MQSFAQTYNPICINRKVLLDAFRYFCSRINKKPGYGLRISSY
ncbi:LacI family transcriptional regulator, partial [Bacteroides stercoris]